MSNSKFQIELTFPFQQEDRFHKLCSEIKGLPKLILKGSTKEFQMMTSVNLWEDSWPRLKEVLSFFHEKNLPPQRVRILAPEDYPRIIPSQYYEIRTPYEINNREREKFQRDLTSFGYASYCDAFACVPMKRREIVVIRSLLRKEIVDRSIGDMEGRLTGYRQLFSPETFLVAYDTAPSLDDFWSPCRVTCKKLYELLCNHPELV